MTLQKAVSVYPEKIALIDGDHSFTYAQINDRVQALCRFFRSQGIGVNDRVAIIDTNSHAFFEAYYSAAGLGAINAAVGVMAGVAIRHLISPI